MNNQVNDSIQNPIVKRINKLIELNTTGSFDCEKLVEFVNQNNKEDGYYELHLNPICETDNSKEAYFISLKIIDILLYKEVKN